MMKKLIWLLLGAAFIWIAVDFVMDSQQTKEVVQQPETSISTPESYKPKEEEHELTEEEESFMDELEEREKSSSETAEELDVVESPEFEDTEEFDVSTKMTIGSDLGQTAYNFELEDMDGKLVKLSDYRGKKVFLNFWASWCPPCRAEMPHLQDFSEKQDEVVVLGVNVTPSESNLDHVQEFLDEMEITFTNVYGERKQADQFRTQSLPTSYFIGTDGVIYDKVVGPVTSDALEVRFDMINE